MVWGSAEYLLWWVKNGPLPVPLVTAGTPASLGILGPKTRVLFGGTDIDYQSFSGGRFTLGSWFDRGYHLGLEGSGFFLEKRPATFATTSDVTGTPVLARPVINAITGRETVELVSAPGVAAGSIGVRSFSNLYGWDLSLIGHVYDRASVSVDVLGGFRYLHVDEHLDVQQNTVLLAGGSSGLAGMGVLPPASVAIFDHFGTLNQFYGGHLGARVEYGGDALFVNVLGKVALGGTHETSNIAGATRSTSTTGRQTSVPGGLLALSSNSARTARDEFAVAPELGVNVGYKINRLVRAYVGYTVLYISDVARPGDQISRIVNPALVPSSQTFGTARGPAQPSFNFQRTDFWAQGVNFGLEIRY
jgi:hypothetical protein